MLSVHTLFDLRHTMAAEYLSRFFYPWQGLKGIRELILSLGERLPREEYMELSKDVWVHHTATVAPTVWLGGPAIVGPHTEIRHGAFIRGSALIGEDCVIGNSTELKNVILFDRVQVPHYNYVGDSILGYGAHLGAGAVTSNVKSDRSPVIIRGEGSIETGLKKMGAMIGDHGEVGCNAVLNPGTILGRNSTVYPTSCVRGVVPANSIYKNDGTVIPKEACRIVGWQPICIAERKEDGVLG